MEDAVAYADNWSDRTLLEQVGRAVVVHPQGRLLAAGPGQGVGYRSTATSPGAEPLTDKGLSREREPPTREQRTIGRRAALRQETRLLHRWVHASSAIDLGSRSISAEYWLPIRISRHDWYTEVSGFERFFGRRRSVQRRTDRSHVEPEHEARRNGHHERQDSDGSGGSTARAADRSESLISRTRKAGPAAVALVIGLAALTAQASEIGPGPRHPALLHGLLAQRAARPGALG